MINAEDIRKYLDGELSHRDMQAIEKAALEDPFLADAIDGFAESRKQPLSFESAVSDLKKRLAERISQKERRKNIAWLAAHWQAAASVLLIITAAAISVTLMNKHSQPAPIATTIQKDSQKQERIPLPAPVQTDSERRSTGRADSDRLSGNRPATAKASYPAPDPAGSEKRKRNPSPSSVTVETETYADDKNKKEIADSVILNKDPLPAAPLPANLLSGRAAGLETTARKKMTSDTLLNEVLVTGYGNRKLLQNKNVEPRMGWEAFNKYSLENKKILTADSLLQGTEILSFVVDQNGILSSFKIQQSISPAHDAESVRLIQSVQWKILKGKKQKLIVAIEYP